MKIAVVDDETLARQRIIRLLNEFHYKENIEQASTGKQAIELINKGNPDLLFLDIQMTDMTGFDVLRKVERKKLPVIIFVTAFDEFAVQAFDAEALDFLIKPYKKERFHSALNRAVNIIESNNMIDFNVKLKNLISFLNEFDGNNSESNNYLDKIVLKVGARYNFVEVRDIKYIMSSTYYAEIFTSNNTKHIYRISMTDFIKKLPPSLFIRINRSTIINHTCIKEVVSEGQGDYSVIMKDEHAFHLTKNYKTQFLNLMNIRQ